MSSEYMSDLCHEFYTRAFGSSCSAFRKSLVFIHSFMVVTMSTSQTFLHLFAQATSNPTILLVTRKILCHPLALQVLVKVKLDPTLLQRLFIHVSVSAIIHSGVLYIDTYLCIDRANPQDPSELSFSKNEELEIIDRNGNWWKARKQDGSVGIVPSNYVSNSND